MSVKVQRMPRAEIWAERIGAQTVKSVESLIEVGRLLVKAKADLPHGEWGRLFDERLLTFSKRTAERFMSIATHPLLSNTTHVSYLPPSWGTLYELTKVPEPELRNAIKDGLITPDMERKSVRALLTVNGTKSHARRRGSDIVVEAIEVEALQQLLAGMQGQLDSWWEKYPNQRATIQAAISSWETYFAIKRQSES